MTDFEREFLAKVASGEVKQVLAFANFLWALGMLIAGYVLQILITPKADKPKPASLDDFDFPQFEEGTPQTVYFGDNWSTDFFVGWYGNLRTSPVKSSGGKK